MSESRVHYNVRITVEKVEHIPLKTEAVYGGTPSQRRDVVTETKRVVTEAGKVDLKHTDFEVVKDLAAKHLDLLTEFEGTDPQRGHTRG